VKIISIKHLADTRARRVIQLAKAAEEAVLESPFLMHYNDLTVGRSGLFEYQAIADRG
jgi:hypothetical protein